MIELLWWSAGLLGVMREATCFSGGLAFYHEIIRDISGENEMRCYIGNQRRSGLWHTHANPIPITFSRLKESPDGGGTDTSIKFFIEFRVKIYHSWIRLTGRMILMLRKKKSENFQKIHQPEQN